MYYKKPIVLARGIRQIIEVVATIGSALLFSYLILYTR